MATAQQIAEQVKLLTDFNASGDTAAFRRETAQFIATADAAGAAIAQATPRAPSAAEVRRAAEAQAEQLAAQQELEQAAVNEIDRIYNNLELSQEQAYLARQGGELGATINYLLQQEKDKSSKRDTEGVSFRTQALQRAAEKLAEEEDAFRAQVPEAVDFRSISTDRARDLATPDGLTGNLVKAAATGLAGIPGLLGIGASALGAEGVGQTLGAVASGIREAAPTDIGSTAASAQAQDIQRRASLPETDPDYLSIPEVVARTARLALTDGDFAADILGSTVGAVAGGGVARLGATGLARVAGASGRAAAPATTVAGRAAQGAGQIAPAVGVGLGAGVDETLTTPQAQALLATGAASTALGGVTGALGGQTAEAVLGQLGRRLPGVNRLPGGVAAAGPTDDLAQIGAGSITARAGARGAASGGAEAAQEFVEGAGESLAESAQGGFDQIDDAAVRRATVAGAAGAPLGAGLGAPLGAVGSVSADRAQNRVNAAETTRIEEVQQADVARRQGITDRRLQRQGEVLQARNQVQQAETARQEEIARQQAEISSDVNAANAAEQQARDAEIDAVRASLVREVPLTPEEIAATPLRQRNGTVRAEPRTLVDLFAESSDVERTVLPLVSQEPEAIETELRALYRNQLEVDPRDLTADGENAFVNAVDIESLQNVAGTDAQITEAVQANLANAFAEATLEPERIAARVQEQQAAEQAAAEAQAQQDEDVVAAEQIQEAEQAQSALDQQEQQADATVEKVFRSTRSARNAQLDSFQTSPQQLAAVGLQDTLLASDTGNDTARKDTVRLFEQLSGGQTSSSEVGDIFTVLARNSVSAPTAETEGFARDFAARMASTADRWKTPQQMVQAARDYLQRYAPPEILENARMQAGLVNNQEPQAVKATIDAGYSEDVASGFVQTEEGIQLTPEAVAGARELAAQSNDQFLDLVIGEQNLERRAGLVAARETLASAPEGTLTPDQAYRVAAARAEIERLFDVPARAQEAVERSRRQGGEAQSATARVRRATDRRELAARALSEFITEPEGDVNPESLVDVSENGATVREAVVPRIEAMITPKGLNDVHGLDAKERRQLTNTKPYGRARRKLRALLDKGEPLTSEETTELADAVDLIQKAIAAKKPRGEVSNSPGGEATTPRIRRSLSAPSRSVETARSPIPQGLLPVAGSLEPSRQFSIGDVQESMGRIMSSWKRKPAFKVVERVEDLPASLRDELATTAGITDGREAYIIASNISSETQLAEVMTEELFHKGLASSLGGNYDAVLARIYRKRGSVDGLIELARAYQAGPQFTEAYRSVIAAAQAGDRGAQLELTDEVLARVGQQMERAPAGLKADVKSVTARIKRYLKQFLPASWFDTVTDNDLHLIIREANVAGRASENYRGPVRVRANRASQANLITLDAAGNRISTNFFDSADTGASPTLKDRATVARNAATAVMDSVRKRDLGNRIYNSTPWQKLLTGLANARAGLERVEVELDRVNNPDLDSIVDQATELDLPPQIKAILERADNITKRRDLMAVNSAVSVYTSRADSLAKFEGEGALRVNEQGDTLFTVIQRLNDAKAALQARLGMTAQQASRSVSQDLIARHAKERNDISFLKSVDIGRVAGAQRDALFASLNEGDPNGSKLREIEALVLENTAPGAREAFVGSGMSDAQAEAIRAAVNENPEAARLYDAVAEATYSAINASNNIKRQTGSFSRSLNNVIEAYGWQNYVPLRGTGIDPDEQLGDTFISHHADNVFSSTFRPFEGRTTLAEDVTHTVYQQALSAIEQHAAQEFIETVAAHTAASQLPDYNKAFEQDGFDGRLLAGKLETMDINGARFKAAMRSKSRNRLVLYNPGNEGSTVQTATVITLENNKGADAVMGAKSVLADNLDDLMRSASVNGVGIHEVTQTMSSLKTWRNLPFIPFDALRNMLTLGYVSTTEEGYSGFKRYVNAYTSPGSNYGKEIFDYVNLYYRNRFAEIESEIEKRGPGSTFAEVHEFFQTGGPTTQLAAIRDVVPGSLQSLGDIPGQGRAKKALAGMDQMFSILNVSADTLSRLAYFRSLKANGVPVRVAAARAKNTANFERRGTWSGPLSGVFEFFRATAVGASALINSTLNGEYGRETAAAAFGAGVSLYVLASMFAGVDDEGEDRMADVNGKLLNNNFVFQYGDDKSDRIQFGLGFGPIAASVASGMQAARFMLGHQSGRDTVDNILGAASSQYQVVPTAGMSILEDPVAFVANSGTPSVLKPIYEVSVNMSSLGIPVRSDYPGADSGNMMDSFQGRYNSEGEMYDGISEALRNSGLVDVNPDNMRHLMRSYGGTMAYLIESLWENTKAVTEDEDFTYRKKAGWYFARQFVGSEFSQTPSDFYNHYSRVKTLDDRQKALTRAGNQEAADQILNDDFYLNGIAAQKAAEKEIRAVNEEYSDILRADDTSTSEARQINRIREEQRQAIFKNYLDAVRD